MSGLLALLGAGSPLAAQGHQVEAGLAAVSFTDDDVMIAGPFVRVVRAGVSGPVRWLGDGTLIATRGAVSGSALVGGSWRVRAGGATLALDADGSTLFGSAARPGRGIQTGARLERAIGASGGVWLRGGGHLAWREAGQLGGRGMDGGAWWSPEPGVSLTGRVERMRAEGQLFAGSGRERVLRIVPVRYTEGSLSLVRRAPWGEVQAGAGARHDRDALTLVEGLWQLAATIRAGSRAAVVLAAAREAPDFVRGADGATSVSIGIRWTAPPAAAPRPPRRIAPGQSSVRLDSSGRLRVVAPGATMVEVMGTFTDWTPVELAPAGPDFLLDRAMVPGSHRIAVRVNGGAWLAPANTPSMDDEFGGRVGLLVVP